SKGHYYQLTGEAFLHDAGPLVAGATVGKADPRLASLKRIEGLLDAPALFTAEWTRKEEGEFTAKSDVVYLTDEDKVDRYYRLRGPERLPGRPTAWLEVSSSLQASDKEKQQEERSFGNSFTASIQAEGEIGKRLGREGQKHAVVGYFRGHRAEARATVNIY